MLAQYLNHKTGCMVPIMGYMFLLFGIVMLIIGSINILSAQSSSSWPVTQGEILTSVVDKKETSTRSKKSRNLRIKGSGISVSNKSEKSYSYEALVSYSYSVSGEEYVGKRIAFGAITKGGRGRAETICESYPVGSQVKVHYDPDDAGSATLEVGIQAQVFFIPGLGAFFLLMGAAILVVRRMRSAAESQEWQSA
jgi:hypothetical protein